MHKALLSALALAVVAFASGACENRASSTGSNTNWLGRCDASAECGSGRECWCHACTVPCNSNSDCGGQGECRSSQGLGCGEPSATGAICIAGCQSDSDCASQGSGLVCRGGSCLPDATGAGAGGASSSAPLEQAVKRFDVSSAHACAVTDGSVYCWGGNVYGAAGDPPGQVVLTARLVRGLADVRSVAVSREHSCALTNAGDVYCWGENGRGQVGGASAPRSTCLGAAGDTPCQPTPTRVEGIAHALQIAVSSGRSCALLSDRTLRCWGDVSALGDFPAKLSDVRRIALGALGACALTSQGELSCSGESTAPVRTPEDVPSLAAVQLSSDTENHSSFACFLGKDGGLGCSGDSNLGQLGLGTLVANSTGKRVLEHTKDVALGAEHACALGDDGSVRCWGKNSDGQVGPAPLASPSCGSATCESAPQLVPGLPPIIAIAAGGNLSCALAQDDTFWCWGADPLSLGAPFRVAGPWEPNGQVCAPFVDDIAKSVYEAAASGRACTTDADCVEVPLDLSCSKTCAVATLSRTSASAAASLVAQIDRDICPHARELGCAEPDITCPPSATRVACNAGRCTQRRRD